MPHRGLEPLPSGKRYVEPARSDALVLTGMFAWAFRGRNRSGGGRKVRVAKGSLIPDGLTAPTQQAVGRFKFKNYFEFGAGNPLRLFGDGDTVNVTRNRAVFVVLLGVGVLYTLLRIHG